MQLRDWRVRRSFVRTVALAALIAALLSACQTNQGPSAEELAAAEDRNLLASGFKQDESLRARFLPPIGNNKPVRGDLSIGLGLEIAIFNVDPTTRQASGAALGPNLSTGAGLVASPAGVYSASWDVSETAANPAASEYVRVEIRVPGTGSGPACNGPSGACIGYVDARIVATGAGGRGGGRAGRAIVDAASSQGFLTVPDHKTLAVNFKVLAAGGDVPASIGELETLSSGGNFDETIGNCSANDFSRPGQGLQAVGAGLQAVGAGLQAVGAVGGLFVADTSLVDGLLTTNTGVAAEVVDGLGWDYYKHDVAILVVDDFGPVSDGVFGLPYALLNSHQLEVGELDELVADGELSHGALVFHQAKQLASAALSGWTSTGTNDQLDAPYVKFHVNYHSRLIVQAVNASSLNTDELADIIRTAVVSMSDWGFKHIVVNMSFAIVPCAVMNDFSTVTTGTSNIATFEEYVAALLEVNEIAAEHLDELGELVSTPLADDEFFAYLDCPLPGEDYYGERCDGKSSETYWPQVKSVVHVAASGNFGNDYALYPAALKTVVSVGSLDVTDSGESPTYSSQRSAFSNAATVLAPGALFTLSEKGDQTVVYAGTSFAAPVMSLFAALDLMSQYPECDPGYLGSNPISGHAMASSDPDDLLDLPLISPFANGGYGTAINEYCQTE